MKTTRQSATLRFAGQACALLFAAASAVAQTPTPILIDINTGNGPVVGSDPGSFARLTATQTVFAASDPVHGRELWITDGTVAGTHLLADICPGACSSTPVPLNAGNAVALGVLYVSADNDALGRELWKVTSAGVVSLVKDINPGALGSNPQTMTFYANAPTIGFFSAISSATGAELWKTDGTGAGTMLVEDINPGPASSNPCCFGAGLSRIYFNASEPNAGRELYMSDGTATTLRADIQSGPGGSSPGNFIEWINDTMIFTADDGIVGRELWITTPTTTTLLKNIVAGVGDSFPSSLTGFDSHVFFSAYSGAGFTNNELWSSDGTTLGTTIFKDICTGSCSSSPRSLTVLNTSSGPRLLFFASSTAGAAPSVYVSDGTVVGTVPIFSPGITNPGAFTISGSLAYFIDTTNRKLYRTDGTTPGTILVEDFGADNFVSIGGFTGIGAIGTNKVVIPADDGFIGSELYIAGPNALNVSLLKNISPDLGYSDPQDLTDVNGTLFFSAFSETTGRELWSVADPAVGAVLVADIVPGVDGSIPTELTAFNGRLIFVAQATANGSRQLYVSDGTPTGTHPLKDLGSDVTLDYGGCLTVVGNRLYFEADGSDGNGTGAWISDGTDAGTLDIHPAGIGSAFCFPGEPGFASVGPKILFQAYDSTHGYELFRTDGTAASTALVRDIAPGSGDSNSSSPTNLVSLGTLACFSAGQGGTDGYSDAEPWCSDGTAQGTLPLGDLNPGTDSSQPFSFTRIGNYVLFSAFSPTLGRRIWRTDGTSANTIAFGAAGVNSVVRDYLTAGTTGGSPETPPLQSSGNVIYFPCTSGAAALCLQDVRPGHEGSGSGFLGVAGGASIQEIHVFPGGDALMSCSTAANGRELCRFNSAFNATTIQAIDTAIVDLAAGAASSSPDQITPSGVYIYFTADDGVHGRELWAVALKDTIDRLFHDGFD